MTITNFHDKELECTSAVCPVTGKEWSIGDTVTIKVRSGRMVVANIAKLRTVRGEIFADVEKEMNLGTYRLTDKLEDLVSC
jgi:hypothetical protein